MKASHNQSLVELPTHTELILYLIKEDLRCQKFFDGLRELGLDDAWYQPDLATLLLAHAGFDTESDAVNDHYYHLRSTHCQLLQPNNESLMEHAVAMYTQLMGGGPQSTVHGRRRR